MREWEATEPLTLPRPVVNRLAAPDSPIEVTPHPDGWILRPDSHVGVFTVGDHRFLIRPKIGMNNLLALLDVETDSLKWNSELFDFANEPDLLVALVRIFRQGLDRALASGLHRDYRIRHERLVTIRGRIDFPAIARRPGPVIPVPCTWDEHTADTPLNQVLLAAIDRSLRVPGVPRTDQLALRRHHALFEDVGPITAPPVWLDDWIPTRLDRHYVPAIRPAKLLLDNATLTDRIGGTAATSYLVDMNKLVEVFITKRLARHLHGRLGVTGQYETKLDEDRRIPIRPDLVFRSEGRPVFVADVKYRHSPC